MAKPKSVLRQSKKSPLSSSMYGSNVRFSSLDDDDDDGNMDGSTSSPTNVRDFPDPTSPANNTISLRKKPSGFRRISKNRSYVTSGSMKSKRVSNSSALVARRASGNSRTAKSDTDADGGKPVSCLRKGVEAGAKQRQQSAGTSDAASDKDTLQGSGRGLFGGLKRRFSKSRFNDMNSPNHGKSNVGTPTTTSAAAAAAAPKNASLDIAEPVQEEDPVMKIFESRNTQRVRFTFDDVNDPAAAKHGGHAKPSSSPERTAGNNVKQFMSRALFGGSKNSKKLNEEMKQEVAAAGGESIVWASIDTSSGPEFVHTKPLSSDASSSEIVVSFTEVPKARAAVTKLLNKARRAEHVHFRYEHAVKCYVKALEILTKSKYPQEHPTVVRTVELLNNAHHVLSSYNNSASIVKMGIRYEESGEYVRALKMYTIAYRIRRDNLSCNHPSLVVLLNMLAGVQVKRGELREAMQIYELALKDAPVMFSADVDSSEMQAPTANLLAKSVTYREMGVIYERIGNSDDALKSYHRSLECVAEWKEAVCGDEFPSFHANLSGTASDDSGDEIEVDKVHRNNKSTISTSIYGVQCAPSSTDRGDWDQNFGNSEKGEMELFLTTKASNLSNKFNMYESFFPPHLDDDMATEPTGSIRDSFADMDLALTIHRIAQLHRCQGRFPEALDAFEVALRGMRYALGKHHPNVAAVLGNIGNLQKEMGNMNAAYKTYQEVLGIESYRLGLSHPDVAITLHNIATIDAAKGNYDHALTLYRKVLGLQKKLFGGDHISVSVTSACMGDVYERLGELKNAIEMYEEAVRIKSAAIGKHSLDVARLLHKIGKLLIMRQEFHMAESYISRSMLIYRLNKLTDNHEWIVDAFRDTADIDAALTISGGVAGGFAVESTLRGEGNTVNQFEC